jgi:hypothetical protein
MYRFPDDSAGAGPQAVEETVERIQDALRNALPDRQIPFVW